MKTRISELMTPHPTTIDASDPLNKASHLFNKKKIKHLPVLSKGKLVGIISYTDMLRMSFGNSFGEDDADEGILEMLSINQVMKHSPVTVQQDDELKKAASILAQNEFHALPVMDKDELVGIVTTTDIIKHMLTLL